ncbi:hypothetical protein BpHYR1_000297 [Brachionus plicatilis]|uniref:Uncharacterized protein n=1 Tax=Brachionus plicatilis TaxID=10195 RepID=A0A3M7RFU0_BRAPC|nr:hypothetical protein BpHYR1_000297 [Brachionus plicatilis]
MPLLLEQQLFEYTSMALLKNQANVLKANKNLIHVDLFAFARYPCGIFAELFVKVGIEKSGHIRYVIVELKQESISEEIS